MVPSPAIAELPPAQEVFQDSLAAHATARCGARAVEVHWIGMDPARLPDGATYLWEGDPCRSRPDLRVSILVRGNLAAKLTVNPYLTVWVEAPVAAKPLAAGEEVLSELALVPIEKVRGQTYATSGLARVALDPGTPLTNLVVSPAPDIRKGSSVELRVTRGSLTITAAGHVLEDGRIGERIKVVNDATRVALDGILIDGATVEIP